MKPTLVIISLLLPLCVLAQQEKRSVVIGRNTSKPNALLVVNPENADQGVLFPQLSTGQRMSLKPSSPAEDGLIVFDTNFQSFFYWSNGNWTQLDRRARETQYNSLDPATFTLLMPNSLPGQNNLGIFEDDNTFVSPLQDGLGEKIIAPIEVPHGAELKEVTLLYMDNDARDLRVTLLRKSLSGGNETLFSWQSSGSLGTVQSAVFTDFNGGGRIDRENYTYRLIVSFDIAPGVIIDVPWKALQRVYGARIKYER